jgi:hypothetical protein
MLFFFSIFALIYESALERLEKEGALIFPKKYLSIFIISILKMMRYK